MSGRDAGPADRDRTARGTAPPSAPALEPVEISAGALHLRPWRPDDAGAVFTACQDPEIQLFTSVPSPYSMADAEAFVGQISQLGWTTGTAAHLAVVDATTGGLLGSVGLHDLRDRDSLPGHAPGGSGEVGYWCAAPARGRGVTTAAVLALCRWGFGALELRVIRWLAMAGNEPSRRVALRAGFTLERDPRRLPHPRTGQPFDFWAGRLLAP
jgi:RimJ/RimL family protein N-acetyltransferase